MTSSTGYRTQSRITQLVAQLPSEQMEPSSRPLIDQYGNGMVFGGGIWPLPDKREAGRAKFSTFFHGDASSNALIPNTYWNSAEAPTISISPGTRPVSGRPVASVPGAAAYKGWREPAAENQLRHGDLPGWRPLQGVDHRRHPGLLQRPGGQEEQEIGGRVMIIEADGRSLSRNARLTGDVVLGNLSAHADYPFALAISGLLGRDASRAAAAPPSRDQG